MNQQPSYRTLVKVKQLVVLAFIAGKLLSYKLWLADRSFPVIPLFEAVGNVPHVLHTLLFACSLALLLLMLFRPAQRSITLDFLFVECCSILLDQLRLQAWSYEYLLLLLPFLTWQKDDERSAVRTTQWLLLIVVATYFWSGLFKCNPGFLLTVWQPVSHADNGSFLLRAGYLLPVVEMLLAIGLLIKQAQRTAAIGLIIMHALILLYFGPLGLGYNLVIWPWNVAMILLLVLLCVQQNTTVTRELWPVVHPVHLLVCLLCIAPALSFFGAWKNACSFKLYTGDTPYLYISFRGAGIEKAAAQFHVDQQLLDVPGYEGKMLSVKAWSLAGLHVMPGSDPAYFRAMRTYLLQHGFSAQEFDLWVHDAPYDRQSMRLFAD